MRQCLCRRKLPCQPANMHESSSRRLLKVAITSILDKESLPWHPTVETESHCFGAMVSFFAPRCVFCANFLHDCNLLCCSCQRIVITKA